MTEAVSPANSSSSTGRTESFFSPENIRGSRRRSTKRKTTDEARKTVNCPVSSMGVTRSAADVNTASRHTDATALSSGAKSYYTGAYAFRLLCSMPGKDTSPDGAMNSYLFIALHDLMSSTLTRRYAYEDLPKYWYMSDTSGGKSGLQHDSR